MHEEISAGVETALTPDILDTTSALSSLYESQVALGAELEKLRTRLTAYSSGTEIIDLKATLEKLQQTEKRLTNVNVVLRQIEARLLGVKKDLIVGRMKRQTALANGRA